MIMKLNATWLKVLCLAIAAIGTAAAGMPEAWAQQPQYNSKLQIESLERLSAKANEVVDVNLDETLMRLVGTTLAVSKDAEAAKVKDIIKGLKGVYVRSYGFINEGEYGDADMTSVRTQLRAPGWLRLVNVLKKREGQSIEVYLMTGGERVGGLAIVALEPKRLTLVNIVGMIDLEKLSQLEGQFGIPELGIGREEKDGRKENDGKETKKP